MQEVSVNKKVVWLGLLSIAVFLAGGIAYYISTQDDLTSDSTDGGVKVEEDAIEIVTAPADGSSAANGGATGGAGSTSADGGTAGAGGKKVAGDGLSDEEREARAIELAQAAGKATPGASGDGNVVSKADIMEAITRVKPLVKDCYDRMLDDFPDAEGKIVVQLKVKAIEDRLFDLFARVAIAPREDASLARRLKISGAVTLLQERLLLGCLVQR